MAINTTRRQFLAGSAGLAAALGLGTSPAWAQQTRLRMIFWGSQPRADGTYKVADLYTAAHPDTEVDGEFLGWADYWPKVATQTSGGNMPDLVQMDYRYLGEYARRGVLARLDGLDGLDVSDMDEDQLHNGTIDGGLYGVSLGVACGASVFNRTALDEAGIEFDPLNFTYDELLEKGQAFRKANEGGPRARMALAIDGSGTELLFENWVRQRGKALYTPEGKVAFEAQDVVDWFTLWDELRQAGAVLDAETQALDIGKVETSPLVTGNAALTFTTSNQLVAYQALIRDTADIAIYPMTEKGKTGGHYRNSSQYWSISAKSPNLDAAAEFVSFFVNDKAAGEILGVERGVPASARRREELASVLDEPSQRAVAFIDAVGKIAGAVPPPPPAAAGEIEAAFRTKAQEIAFGSQSPQEGGEAFHAEVIDTLNRASGA